MGAKLKAVRGELILLCLTAVFLGGLMMLAHRDAAAEQPVTVQTEENLPPEEIEVVQVDLNTAGMEELTTLPGIGEGLARRIINYRTEHGPFETAEELMAVSGIGEKKFEELREYITVDGGAES